MAGMRRLDEPTFDEATTIHPEPQTADAQALPLLGHTAEHTKTTQATQQEHAPHLSNQQSVIELQRGYIMLQQSVSISC